jgi:hypothetical protein
LLRPGGDVLPLGAAPASQLGPATAVPLEVGDGWDSRWELGDIDGDGLPDLVDFGMFPMATGDVREVFVKAGLGAGRFASMRVWPVPGTVAPVGAEKGFFVSPFTTTQREEIRIGDTTQLTLLRAP